VEDDVILNQQPSSNFSLHWYREGERGVNISGCTFREGWLVGVLALLVELVCLGSQDAL
jgi:hypothetical protein